MGAVDIDSFAKFWYDIMTQKDTITNGRIPSNNNFTQDDIEFWWPITLKELHSALPELDKASVPEGISGR